MIALPILDVLAVKAQDALSIMVEGRADLPLGVDLSVTIGRPDGSHLPVLAQREAPHGVIGSVHHRDYFRLFSIQPRDVPAGSVLQIALTE